MSQPESFTVRLLEAEPLGPEARHCVFEASGSERFEFAPGQYVRLSKQVDGEKHERYYSIASAPGADNRFELCIKVNPGGFGEAVAAAAPGAEFDCFGPAGKFRLREPLRDSVFIASGTGISPIRAMLEHLIGGEEDRSQGRGLTLLLGARTADRLLYRERFERLSAERAGFGFLPTLSRPDESWNGLRGHALDHLERVLNGRSDVDVYLCGQPEMVAEARERLERLGVDEDAVCYEKY